MMRAGRQVLQGSRGVITGRNRWVQDQDQVRPAALTFQHRFSVCLVIVTSHDAENQLMKQSSPNGSYEKKLFHFPVTWL